MLTGNSYRLPNNSHLLKDVLCFGFMYFKKAKQFSDNQSNWFYTIVVEWYPVSILGNGCACFTWRRYTFYDNIHRIHHITSKNSWHGLVVKTFLEWEANI